MKLEDLVGSLQTFELKLNIAKKKSIALRSSDTPSKSKDESEDESGDNDNEDVALLDKIFLKQFKKRKSSSSKSKSKDIQCCKCKKCGHIATECPTKV